ncbi:MAG: TonB-dependent receptor domain-containing protein [Rhodothermales bacterium]
MRIGLILLAGIVLQVVQPRQACAQAVRLDVEKAPLKEALLQFSERERVDIVFAERQVKDQTITCHYEGDSLEEALACLLYHTGLRAERVRRHQYVLAEVPIGSDDGVFSASPPPRGMIRGFITDAETGEVLPGAHVYLPAFQLGTTTNEAGYFALSSLPRQAYDVRISYLGYQARDTLLLAGTTTVDIRLSPAALQAEEVVVEAVREEFPVEPGVVNVPLQQLEKLPSFPGEPDLFQALQWLPGVQKAGEINGGLIVRGGEPDQNLYLLDGAPVYHPWHAFSLISTFQTETFKDIKLYRGSFPAEHGGRLSAVLDAELKDGTRATPKAVAAIGVLSGRFVVESPVTKYASFMVSGRRSYLDKIIGRSHPVSENGVRDTLRTGYFFFDTSAKVTARPGYRHRLSISYYEGRDVLDVRLPFDLSLDFSEWLKPADLFFEIDQKWGNQLVSARYQYLFSRHLFVTATAYRSSYRAREATLIRPTEASSVASDYGVRLRDLGLSLDVDFYPSVSHQLRAGMRLVQRGFRSTLDARVQRSPGAVDSLDQTSRLEAFEVVGYVQDSWQPSARWKIQPGLRVSFFSGGSYMRFSPRLGVRYAVDPERLILRGAAGMHVQYLHRVRDRFSLLYDLVSSRWIPSSQAVEPSSSMQVSIGAESYPFPGLTLALDGYWRHARQVLLPRDEFQAKDGLEGPGIEVGTLLGQYTRGRARALGVEASARYEKGPWQVWLTYTGGRSLNRVPELGETVYRAARFDVPRSLRASINRTGRQWAVGFSTEWRSGLPLTVPVARYAVGDPLDEEPSLYLHRPRINNGRLPPYLRFDAVIGFRFKLLGGRFRTQLHVFNVTNRRNIIDRIYDPSPEGAVGVRDRRSLPLLPLLELRMEL